MSFKIFLQNLASLAFDDKPLAIVLFKDRCLIASRSPPHVAFTHPELYKLELPIDGVYSCPPLFESTQEDLDFKIFRLSSNDISYLKNKANANGTTPSTRITSFNVLTAHVWRCKALSRDVEKNKERVSTLLYAVNIRSRLKPPLPLSYCGNAVISSYASAKCGELEEKPFFELVDMVSKGAARLTDEYVRSFIDWHEIYKGFVNGEFPISSWWRLGFAEVEYPWGKPRIQRRELQLRSQTENLWERNHQATGREEGRKAIAEKKTGMLLLCLD
ncbi:HXXXD-type acyl-transferase family protein [Abeliophyllum distichum]|uniref:HXXXD-type acyl-transferase family protein n=1 Tax=Abeliophyllum distichum TaxID=126358 RepID=A0ABD1TIA0_9LAMI